MTQLFAFLQLLCLFVAFLTALSFWREKTKKKVKFVVGFTLLVSLFNIFINADRFGFTSVSATTHLLLLLIFGVLSIVFTLLIVFSVTWALYQLYKAAWLSISRGKRVWDDLPEDNREQPRVTVDPRISKTDSGWSFEDKVYPTLFSAQAALKLAEQEKC